MSLILENMTGIHTTLVHLAVLNMWVYSGSMQFWHLTKFVGGKRKKREHSHQRNISVKW